LNAWFGFTILQASIRMLPADIGAEGELVATIKELNYNLFPLRCGFSTLPTLTVTAKTLEADIPISKGLPRVYIKPVAT
jgi:hypothetical protein